MNLIVLRRRLALACLALVAATGCRPRESTLRVTIRDADGRTAPVSHLPLVLLPYNRDSVLAILTSRARTPRPDTRALDSIFTAIRGPLAQLLRAADLDHRLRDSLELLRHQTAAEPRGSQRYRELYLAFATAADSLTAVEARLAESNRVATAAYRKYGARLDQLKAAMTRWEDSTFRGFGPLAAEARGARIAAGLDLTTGADGRVTTPLPKGAWWAVAYVTDPADANAGWYWNVPLAGDTLELDLSNAVHRPCYSTRCP